MTDKNFRLLIIGWWILGVLCGVILLVTQRYLPVELVNYLDSVTSAEPTTLDWIALSLVFVLFGLVIVASIGLFKFKRWGRALFVWVRVLSLVISPLLGVSIMSGSASAICYLYSMITGGIIFTMYLPPINPMFAKN